MNQALDISQKGEGLAARDSAIAALNWYFTCASHPGICILVAKT